MRYRRLNDEYSKFSKAAGLPEQKERSFIAEFGAKEARKANKAALGSAVKSSSNATNITKPAPIVTNTPQKPQTATYGYNDVTQDWLNSATPNSHKVVDATEFTQDGTTYKVDGRNVQLSYSEHEKEIAELLEAEFGGDIRMMPKVNVPQGIQTPDYLFRGERFDLKTLTTGASKSTLYNAINPKQAQADNFVLDFTNSALTEEEVFRQAKSLFFNYNTRGVKRIFLVNGNKTVLILERK